ncbi:carbamoyltransferase C-terminal domain-containing protein [Nocardia gipuzkoensis]
MGILVAWQNDLDASAALVIDGTVFGAVAEERFTRVKQQAGFPARSVAYLLEHAGLRIDDVDEWPYGFFEGANSAQMLPGLCARVALQGGDEEALSVMLRRLETEEYLDTEIRDRGYVAAEKFGLPMNRVRAYEHHPCHAWSAHAFSPFDESLVVTADGRGDRKSITISTAGDSGVREFEWYSSIDSLGHLYSQVTHVLGFRTNRHEGKITGLAAHGSPDKAREFLSSLIGWTGERILANPGRYFVPSDKEIPEATLERMREFSREDLAAGVQALIEELLCELIASRVRRTGLHDVALAGGVMANVALNRRIRELPEVESVFVQPNMGDGGLPLGAAAMAHNRRTGATKLKWSGMALGPDVDSAVGRPPTVRFDSGSSAFNWMVEKLYAGLIVGVVRGRAEFGPRALGHRSILADAGDPSVNSLLSQRLRRTEFMPFAPIMTDRTAAKALVGWAPGDACSSFMTMAYLTTPSFRERHPAVVHIDGTVRPQVVTRESDQWLYTLLEKYELSSGRSALINTSFNIHEEPIVTSMVDALRALDMSAVDAVCTEVAAWTSLPSIS